MNDIHDALHQYYAIKNEFMHNQGAHIPPIIQDTTSTWHAHALTPLVTKSHGICIYVCTSFMLMANFEGII